MALALTVAIPAAALAGAVGPNGEQYPLAAAMVIKKKLYIVDEPTRTLTPIPLGDLVPEEADLSPDKKWVAVNATPKTGGPSRIYLVDVAAGWKRPIQPPADGDHRFPRFSPDGKHLLFSAGIGPGPSGHHNPARIHRMHLETGIIERIETREKMCEFSPMSDIDGRVNSVSTPCSTAFQLASVDPETGKQRVVESVSGPGTEIAVAPTSGTTIFTTRSSRGLEFKRKLYGKKGLELLTAVRLEEQRVQPRFICPNDLLFHNGGTIWKLNSQTGELTELLEVSTAKPLAGPEPEERPELDGARR